MGGRSGKPKRHLPDITVPQLQQALDQTREELSNALQGLQSQREETAKARTETLRMRQERDALEFEMAKAGLGLKKAERKEPQAVERSQPVEVESRHQRRHQQPEPPPPLEPLEPLEPPPPAPPRPRHYHQQPIPNDKPHDITSAWRRADAMAREVCRSGPKVPGQWDTQRLLQYIRKLAIKVSVPEQEFMCKVLAPYMANAYGPKRRKPRLNAPSATYPHAWGAGLTDDEVNMLRKCKQYAKSTAAAGRAAVPAHPDDASGQKMRSTLRANEKRDVSVAFERDRYHELWEAAHRRGYDENNLLELDDAFNPNVSVDRLLASIDEDNLQYP